MCRPCAIPESRHASPYVSPNVSRLAVFHRPNSHGVMHRTELIPWVSPVLRQIDMPGIIERACDFTEQCRGVNRFDEVQIDTCLMCALPIHILTPTRQGSDEDIAPPRACTNAPARFETINARHLQVHEDDFGPE